MDKTPTSADQWYVAATSSPIDDRTRVLKYGPTFAVFDRFGDIDPRASGEHGIYHQGTRFLSRLGLRVNGQRPMLLNSSLRQDNSLLTVDMTTPDLMDGETLAVRKGEIHIFRAKLLGETGYREHLRVVNYGQGPVGLKLQLDFAADYADIFEVRGFLRGRQGRRLPAEVDGDQATLGYRGLDEVSRRTELTWEPTPDRLTAEGAEYEIWLGPGDQGDIYLQVACLGEDADVRQDPGADSRTISFPEALFRATAALRFSQVQGCAVSTSNDQFNEWLNRSAADLAMLTTGNPEGAYPYAGVPWYSTPMGRDGIITALLYLWIDPAPARSVLRFLAATQADREEPERYAEPGKILHEIRQGELAALGEIPFGRYYGSIDATPLFVVLAGAYYQRTGDQEFIAQLWPHIDRALAWMDRYGDRDGDGFIEYPGRGARGQANQGWKDAHDAIFHADGSLVEGPVALAEVQGYVYLAKLQAAELALVLGQPEKAGALKGAARQLQEGFEKAFWCEGLGTYALALDGQKRQCRVRSSNAGQVLWSGIASPDHARQTAETLLAPSSFSGWGVRTIAEGEIRYNPMSYYNGSVWPHDNALIAGGLALYDLQDKALPILEALFRASLSMDLHRLPELYCGFVRRPDEGPTLYPVACSPQAWASATPFYLLQACLGLAFHPEEPRIRFTHPVLPPFLHRVAISRLQVGNALVDLVVERHGQDVVVQVTHKQGDIQVSVLL